MINIKFMIHTIEQSIYLLLLITTFDGGNIPSKAYKLLSVSFVISKQKQKHKH